MDKDFSAKIPKIFFAVEGFKCELSLNNHMAVQTTKMLRDYMSLDPRVHTLAVAIRYWARLCGIDRQAEGTLPAHAFALLLVFFLQQETKPVLPCLHEHLERRADADAARVAHRARRALGRLREALALTAGHLVGQC